MLQKLTFIYIFGKLVPSFIAFFLLSLYTKFLTPQEYGIFAIIISFVGLGNSFFFQFITQIALRFLMEKNLEQDEVLSHVFLIYLLLLVTSFLFCIPIFIFFDFDQQYLIICSIFLVWIQSWSELNQIIFQAKLNPIAYGIQNTLRSILGLIATYYFLVYNFGIFGILNAMILSQGIASLVGLRNWKGLSLRFVRYEIFGQMTKYGIPFVLVFLFSAGIQYTDRIILNLFGGAGNVGVYVSGVDVTQQTLTTIMMMINLAAYPLALKAYELEGEISAKNQFVKNGNMLISVGLFFVLLFIFLSEKISRAFFGIEFRLIAASIMPWISISAFFLGIKAYYFDLVFQIYKKSDIQAQNMVIFFVLNVLIGVFLIPKFGLWGAVYSNLITNFISMCISYYRSINFLHLPIFKLNWKGVIFAHLGVILYFYMPLKIQMNIYLDIALQVLISGFVYFIFYFISYIRLKGKIYL